MLYATGSGAPEVALAAIAQVRDARRPTLLVLDDADRAPAEVHAAVRELAHALAALPALVLATGQEAAALARLRPRDSVTLEPLDAEAVRLIAALYAPAGGGDAVPVETLLATSRGVARRVHEAAGEWARHEAARRVDAVADRTAAGRSEARALEAELAGNVVDLRSGGARRPASRPTGAEATVVCPYKGLATFDAEDADTSSGASSSSPNWSRASSARRCSAWSARPAAASRPRSRRAAARARGRRPARQRRRGPSS